ncbi:MAG: DUF2142 domain-containing protein [Clostridia bacterium]|nr:DUF2142 domain-containing protein [Clostridia bacterium]
MKKIDEKKVKILFIITITIFALILAIIQPIDIAPDEKMKMYICKYIAENNNLPSGTDEAVRDPAWGISYGFTPILSYICGGLFMRIGGIFSQDIHFQYVLARLPSVIFYCIMSIFVLKIAEKLFKNTYYKWLFILFATIIPQVVFIGSYINNDSLALMSIAIIIYSWLRGLESNWNYKICIMLACGLGLCALSYYNAYGYILTSMLLFIAYFVAKKNYKELFKKGIVIFCISLAICGWWFVRSYILYDGDFLGLNITDEYGEKYAVDRLKPSKRITPSSTNASLPYMLIKQDWIKDSFKSFIGVFGHMDVLLPSYCYFIYLLLFLAGCTGYIIDYYKLKHFKNQTKEKNLLEIIFILNIIIPVILSLYYSYYSDFQAQGRYLMPMLIPIMYFITYGIHNILENKLKIKNKYKNIIKLSIYLLIILVTINTLITFIKVYI